MNDPIDALNESLDGTVDVPADRLDEVSPRVIAEHLLAAGAARQFLLDDADAVRRCVADGMLRVHSDSRRQKRRQIITRIVGPLAVAAAILVTALLWSDSRGLKPVLDRMHAYVTADLDRQFEVRFDAWPQRRGKRLLDRIQPELCVRGTHSYLIAVESNFMNRTRLFFLQGYDGAEYWLLPPLLPNFEIPVIASRTSLATCYGASEFGLMRRFVEGFDRMESSARIFALLDEIERHYVVKEAPPGHATIEGREGQVTILASRHPQAPIDMPETVEFVVDESTGAVHEVVVRFVDLPRHLGIENPFRSIRYRLTGEEVRPAGFYGHRAHHDGRPVIHKDG